MYPIGHRAGCGLHRWDDSKTKHLQVCGAGVGVHEMRCGVICVQGFRGVAVGV